jgi:uncharacterized YokU family protein
MAFCIWCEQEAGEGIKDCYWITPDSRRTVEILQVPAIVCPNCNGYISEEITQKIEDALYLNDIEQLGLKFTYEELMNAPRIKLPRIEHRDS